jgi:NitT/TauT family transport system ATP-binding protein
MRAIAGHASGVALARTLAIDPERLLMNEPFAAPDPLTRASVREMFLNIWERGVHRKTVLFVTHDLGEALLLADRVVTIAGGGVRTDLQVPIDGLRNQQALMAREEYRAPYHRLQEDLSLGE